MFDPLSVLLLNKRRRTIVGDRLYLTLLKPVELLDNSKSISDYIYRLSLAQHKIVIHSWLIHSSIYNLWLIPDVLASCMAPARKFNAIWFLACLARPPSALRMHPIAGHL